MTTVSAIIGVTTYSLNDWEPLGYMGHDGLGMAPVHRITERGPMQHGESDIDFRLDPRVIRLSFQTISSSLSQHYTDRNSILRIFKPSRTAIKLRFNLDNGDVRQIDGHFIGGLGFGSEDRDGFSQKTIVEFKAPDPVFYDPTALSVTYGVGGGSSAFEFPLVFPATFGSSTVNQTRTITYEGTWRDYPIVIIKGPITNPVVTNMVTGDKLDFTGITITDGTTYTIDCRYGYKTVTNNSGTNKISDLTDDSDLATFSLEADPEAPDGENDIRVTGSSANANTEVYIQYMHRYIGI